MCIRDRCNKRFTYLLTYLRICCVLLFCDNNVHKSLINSYSEACRSFSKLLLKYFWPYRWKNIISCIRIVHCGKNWLIDWFWFWLNTVILLAVLFARYCKRIEVHSKQVGVSQYLLVRVDWQGNVGLPGLPGLDGRDGEPGPRGLMVSNFTIFTTSKSTGFTNKDGCCPTTDGPHKSSFKDHLLSLSVIYMYYCYSYVSTFDKYQRLHFFRFSIRQWMLWCQL